MNEIELILTKLKIVSEAEKQGAYVCDKEHSKILLDYIQQKENIIKEVREYIEEHIKYECDDAFNGMQFYSYHLYDFDKKELLEILDKEVN